MPRRPLALASVLLLAPALTIPVGAQAPEAAAATVRVTPERATLAIGETLRLEATVLDEAANELDRALLYFSSSRRRLSVSAEGTVTAHAPGTHFVTVMVPVPPGADPSSAVRTRVTIEVPTPPLVQFDVPAPDRPLYAHTRIRLTPRAVDAAGAERQDIAIEYSSSDPSIAAVDRFGVLRLNAPGSTRIVAAAEGHEATLDVRVLANPVRSLDVIEVDGDHETPRTGDVLRFRALARGADGQSVDDVQIEWAMQARTRERGVGEPGSGLIDTKGRFVADLPGEYTILASAGRISATRSVTVVARDVRRGIELVGHAPVRDRFTSDLWIWEGTDGRDYALTGTWSAEGHAYLWDVTDPSRMALVDTIKVDARTVNDVKVSQDGRIAVISREGASNRRNGLVILDVSEPQLGMRVLARYDDELTGGVHNVFIHEDHIYALSAGRRYDIINIEDPTNPHRVGRFELDTPGHSIHDVWVERGIAYSSNWSDGVVAVDVGGGDAGGSPRNPVKLGSYAYPSGWNHAAFPYTSKSTGKRYVFAGDEAGLSGVQPGFTPGLDLMDGYIHVIEWDTWGEPREVARYRVPGGGSHNLWVEDDVLYIGYYQGGLRAVDVSGELMGDLYRQGREIGYFLALDPEGHIPNVAMTWGPQPYKGNVFFSDMHSGLWAVRIAPAPER